jgi:hypothetical protein
MASRQRVSCWTVDQLAEVVEQAGRRHIGARRVFEISREAFSPDQVAAELRELLEDPDWDQRGLYSAVLDALRALEGRLPGTPRRVEHVHTEISREHQFDAMHEQDVARAIADLAGASKGALILRDNQLVLNTSLDELGVRVAAMVGDPGEPRRPSTFRRSG